MTVTVPAVAPPVPPPGLPPPPSPVRALGPAGAAALAGATVAGALVARPLSLVIPAAVALVAVAVRRPALIGLAAALAASALGARALEGLAPPVPGPVQGQVTLVDDPELRWGQAEAVGRIDGRLVLLRAPAPAAEVVAARLAGERLQISGRLGPPPDDAPWLRARHVSGQLDVTRAAPGDDAAPPWRVANRLRRLLVAGTASLGPDERSLYAGLVLGDDRDQTTEVTDDFRGSGLAHLLAVSGQNVAFVLAVATPLLRRLGLGSRAVAVGLLLALFATLTRFEPSVLRAVAMAAVAALASARGRPTSASQLLALAVTGLVLVDPLLVRSIGFQLSVTATAGIVVLSPRLAAALPGPPAFTLPLAVGASAQLGVAPLLVSTFGGVPVVSLPANLLAAPAAALVMTWGLPAGLAAGLLGGPFDGWLHRPTDWALRWTAAVAHRGASLRLGELRGPQLAAIGAAVLAVVVAARLDRGGRPMRVAAGVVTAAALLSPALALARPPAHVVPAPGVDVWRDGGATVVVVASGTGATDTLEGLRRAGVTRIDLLLVGPGVTAADEERAARHRSVVARVWWLGRDDERPGSVRLGGLEVQRRGEEVCVRRRHGPPCPPVSTVTGAERPSGTG